MPGKLENQSAKRDKEIVKAIKELDGKCRTFFDMVGLCGNQCAWTDRQVEKIIDQAKKLETIYNKRVV